MSRDVTFWALPTEPSAPRRVQLTHFAASQGRFWHRFRVHYADARVHLLEEARSGWDFFFAALVWDDEARPPRGLTLRNLDASEVSVLASLSVSLWARHDAALASSLAKETSDADEALRFVEDMRTLTLEVAARGEGLLILDGPGPPD